jgi:hypothetical protein
VHVALIKARLTAAEWRRSAGRLPPKPTLGRRLEKRVLQPLSRVKARLRRPRGA